MVSSMFILLIFIVSISSCLAAVNYKEYDYNQIQFQQFNTFNEFKHMYLTNQNDTVSSNVFLGVSDDNCIEYLESPAFRGAQRHGNVVTATLPKSEFPLELLNCSA